MSISGHQKPTLESYQRALQHRETYIATLNSLLRDHGAKRGFAQKLNISPQYLSYVLDPWGDRTPSDDLALRIVKNIPASFVERRELLYHMTRARAADRDTRGPATYFGLETIYQVVAAMQEYQLHAANGRDSEKTRQAYRAMLRTGKWALYRIQPITEPYKYTELLVYLHDAANALNLPVTALWYAKSCLQTCQSEHLWQNAPIESRIWLWINGYRTLSASYHNLNLPLQALEAAKSAAQFTAKHAAPREFRHAAPHLARDILNAYAISPRFAISDAEAVANHYLDIMACGTGSSGTQKGLAALLQRSLIEVYLKHGSKRSLQRAQRLIEDAFYRDNKMNLGALCTTLHLRTHAALDRALGNELTFLETMHRAYELAETAGLVHQQKEIMQEIRGSSL